MENKDENKENEYNGKKLKEILSLKYYPVAIKFFTHEDDIVEGIAKINETLRHCEMVKKAADGEIFYSTEKEQQCKGGAAAIGLREMPPKIESGEFYYNLKRFKSIGAAKRTLDNIPKIDTNFQAIAYAPLEMANFNPDIIVLIAEPKDAMTLSQAIVYPLGGRVNANYAGIQSVCADIVAGPFTTSTPNFTLGCTGSRKIAKIKDDEMVIGLNGETIDEIVKSLEAIS
jgi:uncharacterized protein (DUF169 family)